MGVFFFTIYFTMKNLIVAFLDPLCCTDKSIPYSELIPAVISGDEGDMSVYRQLIGH